MQYTKQNRYVCLGYYASSSYKEPSKVLMLQIKDTSTLSLGLDSSFDMLDRFKAQFLPHPIRFHEASAAE